jgi:ribosome-associated protein
MRVIEIHTEFIKLQQLLKLADVVGYGSDAKFLIQAGKVIVNGEIATERGKKIRENDVVSVEGEDEDITVKVIGDM